MRAILSQSRYLLLKSCGFALLLILAQVGMPSVADAAGCSGTSSSAATCQYRFQSSGTVNGSAAAPQPALGGSCTSPPCSDGIRQDAGVT